MNKPQECVFIKKETIDETLSSKAIKGKKLLNPLSAISSAKGLPMNILEDSEILDNEAEVHHHEADLWLCLEGKVQFTYGGEMVDPWFKKLPDGSLDKREVKAKQIKGGEEVTMKAGDWLWIPAGQPHVHNCTGTARLVIIKVPKCD